MIMQRGELMQNIPIFTTENGAASLILKEIPYTKVAYIKVLASESPQELVEECICFCKTAGAEHIYASGHDYLKCYHFHTDIIQMERSGADLPATDAELIPVSEQTLNQWLDIYNQRMVSVDNAAYMTNRDGRDMLTQGGGYYIYQKELLGIGWVSGDRILAIASVKPGAGADIILALSGALGGDRIVLDVASTNVRAVKLYERLGFVRSARISSWYKIF